MIEVKKVVLSILFLLLGISIYPSYKLIIIEKENINLRSVINSVTKDNKTIQNRNIDYEKQINILKEENKTKWEELEVWKKMKLEIEEALSS